MTRRGRIARIVCCAVVFSFAAATLGESIDSEESTSGAADLAGMRCQIWTIQEGDEKHRECTCYEGAIKTVDRHGAVLLTERSRIRTFRKVLGFSADNTEEWIAMNGKPVTIPMDKIDYIRFPK